MIGFCWIRLVALLLRRIIVVRSPVSFVAIEFEADREKGLRSVVD